MVHVISSLRPVTLPARTHATGSKPTATSGASSIDSLESDFQQLFTSKTTGTPAPVTPAPVPAPTAESVFGASPWMSNPTGTAPNGTTYSYNPYYFATANTASIVAQMVGGTVVQTNQFTSGGGGFQQQQPNYMVQLPNGHLINPGLVASFYDHGYSASYVQTMVDSEVKNA
jgi:hypothetical protein